MKNKLKILKNQSLGNIKQNGSIHFLLIFIVFLVIVVVVYLIVVRGNNLMQYNNKILPTPDYSQINLTQEANVNITGSGFNPASIQVKVGSAVTFTDRDSVSTHQVVIKGVFDDGTDLISDQLSSGQSFGFTFNKIGKYSYYDKTRLGQTGYVLVVD